MLCLLLSAQHAIIVLEHCLNTRRVFTPLFGPFMRRQAEAQDFASAWLSARALASRQRGCTLQAATPCTRFGMAFNKPGDAPRGGTPKLCEACMHAQAPPRPKAPYCKQTKSSYADRTDGGMCSPLLLQGSRLAEEGAAAAAARRQHPRSS